MEKTDVPSIAAEKVQALSDKGMPGNSTWIGFFPQGFLAAIPT